MLTHFILSDTSFCAGFLRGWLRWVGPGKSCFLLPWVFIMGCGCVYSNVVTQE